MTETDTAKDKDRISDERAVCAAKDNKELDRFLSDEQQHILNLTGKVLGRSITRSDDEYSVALTAVSEAVKNYDRTRGSFWSYAAFVIKSRETDYYRSSALRGEKEMTVSPDVFTDGGSEDDPDGKLRHDINEKTSVWVDTSLGEEIEELREKLAGYGISFFDLAECSPKAKRSRAACELVLKAVFTPPPLVDEIIRTGSLPIKKIIERQPVSRKLVDRHRKYLLSAAVILSGDYPGISEYIPYNGSNMDQRTQR